MPMGYGSNFAEVIEQEELEKLVPDELKDFLDVIDKDDECLEGVAQNIDDPDNVSVNVQEKYLKLRAAFMKKTRLELELRFHDSDDAGDCYDEVNGAFWSVDGMYQLSPAGKKMSKVIERKFFVTHG